MYMKKFNSASGINKQHGAIVVLSAAYMLMLLMFVGLAIDVGYMMTVRNQLQNAADAAALYGADYLVHLAPPGTAPNFNLAKSKAIDAFNTNVQKNTANNVALAIDGNDIKQIDAGYWDMSYPNSSGSLPGIQHFGTPPTNTNLAPAIKVGVQMNKVINNPINAFFIKVLGMLSYNMNATAVAVAPPSPSCIGEGVLLPVVMNKCAFDEYWDSSTNSPKIVPEGTTLLPGYPTKKEDGPQETPGTPYVFWLTSSYHAYKTPGGTCEAGQWTSLSTEDNSPNAVRDVLENFGKSNSETLCTGTGAGHRVYIQPGSETTIYENKNQPSIQTCASIPPEQAGSCAYALIPVINENPIATKEWSNVVAFACVHVRKAEGGSSKYIEVQMVAQNDPNYGKYCVAPNSGGAGTPSYGVTQPPALVNYFGNTY